MSSRPNRLLKNGCGSRVWPFATRDASEYLSQKRLCARKASRAKGQPPQAVAAGRGPPGEQGGVFVTAVLQEEALSPMRAARSHHHDADEGRGRERSEKPGGQQEPARGLGDAGERRVEAAGPEPELLHKRRGAGD